MAHAEDLATKLAAGSLPPEEATQTAQLILNDRVNIALTALFMAITWLLVFETLRVCVRSLRGRVHPPLSETPYVAARLGAQ